MATLGNMLNAYEVFKKLATDPNMHVPTSLKLLPVLRFLAESEQEYLQKKDAIIVEDTSADEKEQALKELLSTEVEYPEVSVVASNMKFCGLTMVDVEHIHWWLVERLPDEEFEE